MQACMQLWFRSGWGGDEAAAETPQSCLCRCGICLGCKAESITILFLLFIAAVVAEIIEGLVGSPADGQTTGGHHVWLSKHRSKYCSSKHCSSKQCDSKTSSGSSVIKMILSSVTQQLKLSMENRSGFIAWRKCLYPFLSALNCL